MTGSYTSAAAIVAESALLSTLSGVAYLITFAIRSDVAVFFLSIYAMFTVSAPCPLPPRESLRREPERLTRSSPTVHLATAHHPARDARPGVDAPHDGDDHDRGAGGRLPWADGHGHALKHVHGGLRRDVVVALLQGVRNTVPPCQPGGRPGGGVTRISGFTLWFRVLTGCPCLWVRLRRVLVWGHRTVARAYGHGYDVLYNFSCTFTAREGAISISILYIYIS